MSGAPATALTIIFVISLFTLLAQLFYVLWRRRVFHCQNTSVRANQSRAAEDNHSHTFSDCSFSSKELLYFCLKSAQPQIPRLESNSAPPTPSAFNSAHSSLDAETEAIDLLKLQNMYGPSGVLFTIKEEEGEADEEPNKSLCSSAKTEGESEQHSKRAANLDQECFNFKEAEEHDPRWEEVVVVVMGAREMTPFSTPCGSPLYFTPHGSPDGLDLRD